MDIVARLKFFMDSLEIPSSQFADSCRIPRPTLSQLLNGRNKKISDEIITKIHEAYPELSIVWLMFGEGDMRVPTNIRFSEPQKQDYHPIESPQSQLNQANNEMRPQNNFVGISSQSRNSTPYDLFQPSENHSLPPKSNNIDSEPSVERVLNSIQNEKTKKITTILVFYDDNSFESFTPAP